MREPTKKEWLVFAFERAGSRGLCRRELADMVGPRWRQRVDELEAEGHLFEKKLSKYFPGQTWRWVWLRGPEGWLLAADAPSADDGPGTLALFEAPTRVPESAVAA